MQLESRKERRGQNRTVFEKVKKKVKGKFFFSSDE